MSRPLDGKVALVTGGSRGIGAAIAKALADDGAAVAISYSASAGKAQAVVAEIEAKGGRAAAFKADQSRPEEVEALVEQVAREFGRLDILVNNAGVVADPEVNDAQAEFQRIFDINVGGVATAVRAAARLLQDGGRIINIGSVLGERVPFPGVADYSASKGAVALYTRAWARDFGPRNITVNNVQPGPIDTDMNPDDGEFADAIRATTALGRYGKPEEIAHVVAFLAGPGASYVTGASVTVDGGSIA